MRASELQKQLIRQKIATHRRQVRREFTAFQHRVSSGASLLLFGRRAGRSLAALGRSLAARETPPWKRLLALGTLIPILVPVVQSLFGASKRP